MCRLAVLILGACMFGAYYCLDLSGLQHGEQKNEFDEESGGTNPEKAEQWRLDAWRDENGSVSSYGLQNAVEQRDEYLRGHKAQDGLGSDGIAKMNWLSIGPRNVGGRTKSLVFDPTSETRGNTIWAGAASGGVWKSVPTARGGSWVAMNGGLQNFAINCMLLDINPSNPLQKTLWAGTGEGFASPGLAGGGLFKSTNGGMTWERIAQSFLNKWQYIDSLAITRWNNPHTGQNETVMLAGVENYDLVNFPRERGIMRSTDANDHPIGESWVQVYDGVTSFSIVVDPSNPGNVVAEIRAPYDNDQINRVVYSIDAGEHWTTATRFNNNSPTPTVTATSTRTPTSTATGTPTPSPTPTASPTPEPSVEPPVDRPSAFETGAPSGIVKLFHYAPNIVYAEEVVREGEGIRSQISRSTNGGQTFYTEGRTGILDFRAYTSPLWISPNNPNLILTGGVSLYRSTDSGVHFSSPFSGDYHGDEQFVAHVPTGTNNKVYIASDGGIHRTDDVTANPVTIVQSNNNYQTTQFFTGTGTVGAGSIPGIIFGGTQDNGSPRLVGGNPNSADLTGGDGLSTAVDGTYCYGESGFIGAYLTRFSNCQSSNPTAGAVWRGITDYYHSGVGFPQIKVDQTDPNKFFFGGSSVWRSDNILEENADNVNWIEIKKNPVVTASPTGSQTPGDYKPIGITALDLNPANHNVLWVAESLTRPPYDHPPHGRLYKTYNALVTPNPTASPAIPDVWTPVEDNHTLNQLPDRQVLKILIDQYDPDSETVYVGIAGAKEDNLWLTKDGGKNWRNITGDEDVHCQPTPTFHGLPCGPINAIAIDPHNHAKVYVGTDIGIYVSEDVNMLPVEDIEWMPVMDGPVNVKISDLNFLKGSNKLLAATYGRGLWVADLNNPRLNPAATHDFDGDGRSDIAIVREDSTHKVWHIDGSTESYRSQEFGNRDDQAAPADYDGDGKTDVAIFRGSQQKFYCLKSSDGTVAVTQIGQSNDIALPGSADFDGDDLADETVFDISTGDWHVERSEQGHLDFHWGEAGDTPVALDFIGDGLADFGVYHEANGMITLSYTNGADVFNKQFGLEGDIPVPGEYDGDKAMDLAVWRPDDDGEGNGCWYISYGANSYEGYDAIPWGESGDIPVPGDYDGDGKLDVAVFRPSTGMWHMLESSNGYYSELFGADGDLPPGVRATYASRGANHGTFTRAPSWAEPKRRTEVKGPSKSKDAKAETQ